MKKLNETGANNPFRIPENYFEEVNRKILSDVTNEKHEVRKAGYFYRFRNVIAIAASIAVLVFLSFSAVKIYTFEKNNNRPSEIIFGENPDPYINDIDLLMLENKAALLDVSKEVPVVSNAEIIDYLLFENIELSDIYEQL
jgi:hypothetical protein